MKLLVHKGVIGPILAGLSLVFCLGHGSCAAGFEIDPRGPISVPGIVAQVEREGVQAKDYHAKDFAPKPIVFNTSWIWLDSAQPHTVVGCFRKQLNVPEAPSRVLACVSADRHYRLYVNGHLASRGPADPGEDYPGGKSAGHTGITYADQCDLTRFFHAGSNTITCEVFADRISDWYGSSGHPGLLFDARIAFAHKPSLRVQSDKTWHGVSGTYFDSRSGLTYDAAQEPQGWRLSSFDDTLWPTCVDAGAHWPGLRVSELPPFMEARYPAQRLVRTSAHVAAQERDFLHGKAIHVTTDETFGVQYDRVLSGYAGIMVKGGRGVTLNIALNEHNSSGGRRTATLILGDGAQYFETPFYSSFSVINLTVSHVTTPIEIVDICANAVSLPVSYRGAFECSNDDLNRLWKAARWQTQMCLQDHHLDSPDHQEPICDPGDYLIEAMLSYYAFGETPLIRQDLRKFGALLAANDYINFHTSYALLWLQMLVDYYDYTGDDALLKELSPQVYGLLDKFTSWRGKNGLISEAPDYMFMDWVDTHGIASHHPPAVIGQGYLTAFYYQGLANAVRVAQSAHDAGQAAKFRALRPDVQAAFNRELWNADKGLYRDGKPFQTSVKPGRWLPADTDIETFSPQCNALAVLYDLASQERQRTVMTNMMSAKPINAQPYFYYFIFSALAHCGLFDQDALQEMKRWKIDSETQTFPEMFDHGDYSHAWGGAPLYQLSAHVLGVTPTSPGFKTIALAPQLCDLSWARGVVPSPHGDIAVSWRLSKDGFDLDTTVPVGSVASLTLPLYHFKHAAATHDGMRVSEVTLSQPLVLRTGRHHVHLAEAR